MKEKHTLQQALVEFQKLCPTIEKTAQGYGYKYAPLPAVIEIVLPILSKLEISLTQTSAYDDNGRLLMITQLRKGDESISSSIPMSFDGKGNMQAVGTAISYARRYGLCCALAIVTDEDTDDADVKKTSATDNYKTVLIQQLKVRLKKFPEYEKTVIEKIAKSKSKTLDNLTPEQYSALSAKLSVMEEANNG